ncbi:histidinol-phosphatase [Chelatococcus asaccharovorans]|uniref:Histidinol-phosphatase n=1 Tax=Chelatococcus asaccharovorans TaxID=28210 RepID=A0A2V3TZA6_9HYPH|nr:histidinol-phosphatase [Chelatococcus asaccharovorans]MBS7704575.1 histidinol-phosphatase [Chelatococcus asaccharovorans]PXW54477.1 myo-inositol-1(or 4)-monophosphatase [Chelatococcus asaccharovorans]CAH1648558.1 Myo-inositol-1(Or 4)-monophosphatase [Chelatococcus asaccharovorans]CAH1687617.1 Myo-inositol-1(Or 4)-monophosphatase [Chelatococcus asaccharovorans]
MTVVDIARFTDDLATRSGQVIMPFFRSALRAEDKSGGHDFDPVTEADRAAEALMRQLIRATFPAHGIAGEEFGDEQTDADYVWVLDPIDGTKAFIAGLPLWGTLIGLKHKGQPVYGLMHQPFTGERFVGDGQGARYRGPAGDHALKTRACASLAEATISTTSPHMFKGEALAAYRRVEEACRLHRYGYDCYAYCMVAAGHIDLVIEAGLKPCDILPLIPIITGAGGIVTDWQGNPVTDGGSVVVAGDARVHAAALSLLSA